MGVFIDSWHNLSSYGVKVQYHTTGNFSGSRDTRMTLIKVLRNVDNLFAGKINDNQLNYSINKK